MIYYNNYRYQWNLKKMAPVQYRNHLLASASFFFTSVLDIGTTLQ
ncbi:IS3 family transposase [Listeria sp. FSL L7-1582]|nr:IS3 family transposase [Listeria portnoyi]